MIFPTTLSLWEGQAKVVTTLARGGRRVRRFPIQRSENFTLPSRFASDPPKGRVIPEEVIA